MNFTQSRKLRRIIQAARLDARLAQYMALVDYDGGPVPEAVDLQQLAAEHYQLQNWLRHNKPATF